MVALLVLATFAGFLLVDLLLNREAYRFRVAEEEPAPETAQPTLFYHPGHTWAREIGGDRLRVGVDDLAASLLGDVSAVEIPPRHRWMHQGDKGWVVETPNGRATLLAPVEGEIVDVNQEVLSHPEVLTEDPYGKGWIAEIRTPEKRVTLRNLLSGSLAATWTKQSVTKLREAVSGTVKGQIVDHGRLIRHLGSKLQAEKWEGLTHAFFLS